MVEFLVSGRGQVGIYDTTTTISPERRQHVLERLTSRGIETIFIETIVEDESIIESNIRAVKLNMPDYIGWDPDDAVKDFFQRIEHHRDVYKEISDPELSYVRVLNIGLEGVKIFANRVQGYLQTRIVYYLMNLHMSPRIIYFAKNGISAAEHNLRDDPPLSSKGDQFARNLAAFMSNLRHSGNRADGRPMNALRIWTSVRKRSWQTARYFDSSEYQVEPKRELAELNPGVTEGLSAAEVRACMPEDAERYERDPYHYRFPRAESYHDLALRLEPFIMDLEREVQDILIISHESVLRCLYAYYFNLDEDEIPSVSIPDNVVIQIIPKPYGSAEKQHVIPHCT